MTAGLGFWQWSLDAYERPGVKDALLDLQDRCGFSVNLLLFAIWASERHPSLTPQQWRSAIAIVEDWSGAVTERLRAARRSVGSSTERLDDLRKMILSAEIEAERHEQFALERFAQTAFAAPGDNAPRRNARRNLAGYAAAAGATRKAGFSVAQLERLVDLILGPEAPDGEDDRRA